jgi:NADH-quinone oxidoreductase subunit C
MEDFASPALRKLIEGLPGAVLETHAERGDATALVDAVRILDALRLLRDAPDLGHLLSTRHLWRVRVKAGVAEVPAQIDSCVEVWPSANWMEREVWDLYGIRFRNHPDLRRLLLYEEFEGHPLRKDYPKERRQPLIGPRN